MAKSHPGVRLKEKRHRSGRSSWVAVYADPDTGKERQESLSQYGITAKRAREEWAKEKSKELQRRRLDRSRRGAGRGSATTFPAAVAAFVDARRPEVRPGTIKAYEKACPKLVQWAAETKLKYVEDLTLPLLSDFRTWFIARPKMVATKGGRRGEKCAAEGKRAARGLNSDLSSIRAMVNEWRRSGRVPKLTSDDIKDGLRRLSTDQARPAFLPAKTIKKLVRAALRHDRDLQGATAKDKAGRRRKQPPIAPVVVFALLSGCRLGEILSLTWDDVDLEAQGGRGELTVLATAAKTRTERAIDLGVSPALRRLLARMQLQGAADSERLFPRITRGVADAARQRLVGEYGAPEFNWSSKVGTKPALRSTCGTFLTNAPGIFGAASAYRSAKQLGHSVVIAERHYVGLVHVPPEADTLDRAMGIDKEVAELVARLGAPGARKKTAQEAG